jgi:hypothetical protein
MNLPHSSGHPPTAAHHSNQAQGPGTGVTQREGDQVTARPPFHYFCVRWRQGPMGRGAYGSVLIPNKFWEPIGRRREGLVSGAAAAYVGKVRLRISRMNVKASTQASATRVRYVKVVRAPSVSTRLAHIKYARSHFTPSPLPSRPPRSFPYTFPRAYPGCNHISVPSRDPDPYCDSPLPFQPSSPVSIPPPPPIYSCTPRSSS